MGDFPTFVVDVTCIHNPELGAGLPWGEKLKLRTCAILNRVGGVPWTLVVTEPKDVVSESPAPPHAVLLALQAGCGCDDSNDGGGSDPPATPDAPDTSTSISLEDAHAACKWLLGAASKMDALRAEDKGLEAASLAIHVASYLRDFAICNVRGEPYGPRHAFWAAACRVHGGILAHAVVEALCACMDALPHALAVPRNPATTPLGACATAHVLLWMVAGLVGGSRVPVLIALATDAASGKDAEVEVPLGACAKAAARACRYLSRLLWGTSSSYWDKFSTGADRVMPALCVALEVYAPADIARGRLSDIVPQLLDTISTLETRCYKVLRALPTPVCVLDSVLALVGAYMMGAMSVRTSSHLKNLGDGLVHLAGLYMKSPTHIRTLLELYTMDCRTGRDGSGSGSGGGGGGSGSGDGTGSGADLPNLHKYVLRAVDAVCLHRLRNFLTTTNMSKHLGTSWGTCSAEHDGSEKDGSEHDGSEHDGSEHDGRPHNLRSVMYRAEGGGASSRQVGVALYADIVAMVVDELVSRRRVENTGRLVDVLKLVLVFWPRLLQHPSMTGATLTRVLAQVFAAIREHDAEAVETLAHAVVEVLEHAKTCAPPAECAEQSPSDLAMYPVVYLEQHHVGALVDLLFGCEGLRPARWLSRVSPRHIYSPRAIGQMLDGIVRELKRTCATLLAGIKPEFSLNADPGYKVWMEKLAGWSFLLEEDGVKDCIESAVVRETLRILQTRKDVFGPGYNGLCVPEEKWVELATAVCAA